MWTQAGFDPSSFWEQTPATFQACMVGVRARLESAAEGEISLAWHTAAFSAQAQSKRGLKPLSTLLRKPSRRMSDSEMLGNMQIIARRANRAAQSTTDSAAPDSPPHTL